MLQNEPQGQLSSPLAHRRGVILSAWSAEVFSASATPSQARLGPLLLADGGVQVPSAPHVLPAGQSASLWHETGVATPVALAPEVPHPVASPPHAMSNRQVSGTRCNLQICMNGVNIMSLR